MVWKGKRGRLFSIKNINLEINSDTNSNSDNEKSIKIKKTAKKVIKIINSDSSDTS